MLHPSAVRSGSLGSVERRPYLHEVVARDGRGDEVDGWAGWTRLTRRTTLAPAPFHPATPA